MNPMPAGRACCHLVSRIVFMSLLIHDHEDSCTDLPKIPTSIPEAWTACPRAGALKGLHPKQSSQRQPEPGGGLRK